MEADSGFMSQESDEVAQPRLFFSSAFSPAAIVANSK